MDTYVVFSNRSLSVSKKDSGVVFLWNFKEQRRPLTLYFCSVFFRSACIEVVTKVPLSAKFPLNSAYLGVNVIVKWGSI